MRVLLLPVLALLFVLSCGGKKKEEAPPAAPLQLTLDFSSYFGGAEDDLFRDVAFDSQGNLVLVGGTASSDYPVTTGPSQQSLNNRMDVAVVKMAPDGTLLWARLHGGPGFDCAYGVEVDGAGNIYIGGRAGDGFVPADSSKHGFLPTFVKPAVNYGPDGETNAFVAKLDSSGDLLWASYFAASGGVNDYCNIVRDLDISGTGEIFLAASYNGGTYPGVIDNVLLNSPPGGTETNPTMSSQWDSVVAKVSTDGQVVHWARFVGGSGTESIGNSIRRDSSGAIYLSTYTDSSDAASPGSWDTSYNGGRDFLLSKLSPLGNLLWSTYIGGSGEEVGETHGLFIDADDNPLVCALTNSQDFPVTPGAYQDTYGGGLYDLFLSRISPDGSVLLESTYIGGNGLEHTEGFGVDAQGRIYIGGGSDSTDLVPSSLLAGSFQAREAGNFDAMMVVFSPDMGSMLYGTFIGGSGEDYSRAFMVSPSGRALMGGGDPVAGFPHQGRGTGPVFRRGETGSIHAAL